MTRDYGPSIFCLGKQCDRCEDEECICSHHEALRLEAQRIRERLAREWAERPCPFCKQSPAAHGRGQR